MSNNEEKFKKYEDGVMQEISTIKYMYNLQVQHVNLLTEIIHKFKLYMQTRLNKEIPHVDENSYFAQQGILTFLLQKRIFVLFDP